MAEGCLLMTILADWLEDEVDEDDDIAAIIVY
jgi:hypothetical protein